MYVVEPRAGDSQSLLPPYERQVNAVQVPGYLVRTHRSEKQTGIAVNIVWWCNAQQSRSGHR